MRQHRHERPSSESRIHERNGETTSRREFLKQGGGALAGAAFAGTLARGAYAGEDNTIRLALIGCGGRGSGAVANALSVPDSGPVKLYAMADVFEDRLNRSYRALRQKFGDRIDAPPERQFVGFDAYKKAIDCLRPGDVALLTAYAYCRPTHYEYAVRKGVNIFMEKPFASDPAGSHRMLRVNQEAKKKNLKIAGGLMCRHSVARQAFIEKVRNGELGDLLLIRAYRMGRGGQLPKRPEDRNEVEWQIRHRVYFFWGGAGRFIELMIHQIDECCWLKDGWPVAAHGMGGRAVNNHSCGQNLDTYSIEYTFADGSKAMVYGRDMNRCYNDFATFVHGTRKAGQFSGNIHAATVHTYKDQRMTKDNIDWKADKEPCSPWQAEWNVLLKKIRKDEPHNETERVVYANLASILGRAAVHYQRVVTWDEVMSSQFAFCPYVDELTFDSPAPVQADADGHYPVPIAGQWQEL
ncbi:MAG: Gfo/Idh/MocA family oxidoreductase [Planctomycetes bacterium]|nr:Gfo/Idh/MocA family oxidoreductase [Planctomycetota bacterium]